MYRIAKLPFICQRTSSFLVSRPLVKKYPSI